MDVTDSPVICPLPWHLVVFKVVGPQAALEMWTTKSGWARLQVRNKPVESEHIGFLVN